MNSLRSVFAVIIFLASCCIPWTASAVTVNIIDSSFNVSGDFMDNSNNILDSYNITDSSPISKQISGSYTLFSGGVPFTFTYSLDSRATFSGTYAATRIGPYYQTYTAATSQFTFSVIDPSSPISITAGNDSWAHISSSLIDLTTGATIWNFLPSYPVYRYSETLSSISWDLSHTYQFNFYSDASANGDGILGQVQMSSFNIEAVPEPCTLLLLATAFAVFPPLRKILFIPNCVQDRIDGRSGM